MASRHLSVEVGSFTLTGAVGLLAGRRLEIDSLSFVLASEMAMRAQRKLAIDAGTYRVEVAADLVRGARFSVASMPVTTLTSLTTIAQRRLSVSSSAVAISGHQVHLQPQHRLTTSGVQALAAAGDVGFHTARALDLEVVSVEVISSAEVQYGKFFTVDPMACAVFTGEIGFDHARRLALELETAVFVDGFHEVSLAHVGLVGRKGRIFPGKPETKRIKIRVTISKKGDGKLSS